MSKSYLTEEEILHVLEEDSELSCLSDDDIEPDVSNNTTNGLGNGASSASECGTDDEGEPAAVSGVASKHSPPDNNGPSTSFILPARRDTTMRCIRTKQSWQRKRFQGKLWTGPLDPTKIQVRIHLHKNFTYFFPFFHYLLTFRLIYFSLFTLSNGINWICIVFFY